MPCRPIDIYGFLRKRKGPRHDKIQPSPTLNLCWRGRAPFAAAAAAAAVFPARCRSVLSASRPAPGVPDRHWLYAWCRPCRSSVSRTMGIQLPRLRGGNPVTLIWSL